MKLLDHYSEFRRALHTCENCGWQGKEAAMKNGSCHSLGIDKHCPACGERHSFAKFSVLAENETPDDWPPAPRS